MSADPGLDVLEELFRELMIEEEWSQWGDRSFTWWPHRVAQRLTSTPAVEMGSTGPICWVAVETDLFRASLREWLSVAPRLKVEAVGTALSGPVWRDGVVMLRSAVPVHEQSLGLAWRLLRVAAVEQVAVAEVWLETLPSELEHSTSGSRTAPNEMVQAARNLPGREGPSQWRNGAFLGFGQRIWEESDGAIWSTDGSEGCSIEIPVGPVGGTALWGCTSDIITAATEKPHWLLGSGVWVRLKLRFWPELKGRPIKPIEMNALEAESWADDDAYMYQLGSWGVDPDHHVLAYTSFYPSLFAHEKTFETLAHSQVNRSLWVARHLLNFDVEESFQHSREKNAEMRARSEAGESLDDYMTLPDRETFAKRLEANHARPWSGG